MSWDYLVSTFSIFKGQIVIARNRYFVAAGFCQDFFFTKTDFYTIFTLLIAFGQQEEDLNDAKTFRTSRAGRNNLCQYG